MVDILDSRFNKRFQYINAYYPPCLNSTFFYESRIFKNKYIKWSCAKYWEIIPNILKFKITFQRYQQQQSFIGWSETINGKADPPTPSHPEPVRWAAFLHKFGCLSVEAQGWGLLISWNIYLYIDYFLQETTSLLSNTCFIFVAYLNTWLIYSHYKKQLPYQHTRVMNYTNIVIPVHVCYSQPLLHIY